VAIHKDSLSADRTRRAPKANPENRKEEKKNPTAKKAQPSQLSDYQGTGDPPLVICYHKIFLPPSVHNPNGSSVVLRCRRRGGGEKA